METIIYENESAMSMVFENLHDATVRVVVSKSRSGEDSQVPAAAPEKEDEVMKREHQTSGVKLYGLVAVSFGLLCILQVTLNIFLHLALFADTEARFKNLTEEREELERKMNISDSQYHSLTEERDELKKRLKNFESQYNSLTEESDKLKRRLKNGWLYFSGSLYYISSNEKTWQESRKDCLQKDADLIIINNKEEQNFMREFKKYLWIGLTDIETEGKWKWVDGTPLTRSFWGSKEPNGKTLENCGQIKHPDSENNWNDERCSNPHYWICEEKFSP
ncbi:C-type lectin domain family 4 member M-like [Seriola dumerili]|uniref:C-type lectin domain family 4 member M-like n=1 Tax=Seriola dumerili TaxID=41447 RepID=UPI000BBE423D|nr:C-type lectin domain family 4 member M-like [Seriola dumerili]